jgi:hypothetical protein
VYQNVTQGTGSTQGGQGGRKDDDTPNNVEEVRTTTEDEAEPKG